jgi:very-short-patch-repair endonuclease
MRLNDAKVKSASFIAALARHGYRVIRFWNNESPEHLDDVRETVCPALE